MMTREPSAEPTSLQAPADTLRLLRAQNALYDELESVAARQRRLISSADTGPLLAVLADRQKLTEKLATIAGTLEPIRGDWSRYREGLDADQRLEAEALLEETRARLRRVMERDAEDVRLLSARKQTTAQAMTQTHSSRQAISAYRPVLEHSGRLDRMDEEPR